MPAFNQVIKDARLRLGFSSAKDFFRAKKEELSISYESYANIEAGKYLPSADKLEKICNALEIENLKKFIFSYCEDLMPNELFRSYFQHTSEQSSWHLLKSDSYSNYKEKFQALLQFNQIQNKFELNADQIKFIESDLVSWDLINLFIIDKDEGYSVAEISEKTKSDTETTLTRIERLCELGILKKLGSTNYIATQDAFIIPRKPFAEKLTYLLVKRELDKCYNDARNTPYTRFRSMSIDPEDRNMIELFIDNFILDTRRFKKSSGKTHYLQILFSDRNDLV